MFNATEFFANDNRAVASASRMDELSYRCSFWSVAKVYHPVWLWLSDAAAALHHEGR